MKSSLSSNAQRSSAMQSWRAPRAAAAFLLSGLLFLTATPGWAQTSDKSAPRRLVIYPVTAPEPALGYQLLPKFLDRLPGNAAVEYGKVTAEQIPLFSDVPFWNKVVQWGSAPLEELRRDQALSQLQKSQTYDLLVRAARRESCDWQVPFREKGQFFYQILLPELSQTRNFARFLTARARAEIAAGQMDRSLQTLQAGYALGQNVGSGPTFVHEMVGVAISGMMSQQVEQFIQQPRAPNLYWALSMLPQPLIDVRPGLESERNALYLSFPELQDIETSNWSADHWQDCFNRLVKGLDEYVKPILAGSHAHTPDPADVAAMAVQKAPMARQYLVNHGYARQAVDAMPVPKLALLYTLKTYEGLRDMASLPCYLPYPEAEKAVATINQQFQRFQSEGRAIIPLVYDTLPPMYGVRETAVQADREIALLRVVEALRIHAAAHAGRLPEKLADISDVYVPPDPVTEKPFQYTLRGDTALIQGPQVRQQPFSVEIRIAK